MLTLTLSALLHVGCDRGEPAEPAHASPSPETPTSQPSVEPKPEPPGLDVPTPPDRALPSLAPTVLSPARQALKTKSRLLKALTVDTPGLDAMRALEVRWRTAPWAGAVDEDTDTVDDDDVRTRWVCTAEVCALGTGLSEGTRIHALRWSGGDAELGSLRLHTDAGFVDVGPLPADRSRWIVFDPPVPTTTLTFEAPKTLSVGDVEVFGSGGTAKLPSAFDPTQAAVSPVDPWAELAQWRLKAEVCLAAEGICELRGTAALGTANGRLVLIEAIHRTDCEHPVGVYLAFDRQTHRIVKLPTATRIPTEVYVHPGGEGFGLVRADGQIARIRVEDGRLLEDVVPTGPSFGVVPVGRPATAAPAPQACPPSPSMTRHPRPTKRSPPTLRCVRSSPPRR